MSIITLLFGSKAKREAEAARIRREVRLKAIEREHARQHKVDASEWVESVLARESEYQHTRQRLER